MASDQEVPGEISFFTCSSAQVWTQAPASSDNIEFSKAYVHLLLTIIWGFFIIMVSENILQVDQNLKK